jgi:hypothetical protein
LLPNFCRITIEDRKTGPWGNRGAVSDGGGGLAAPASPAGSDPRACLLRNPFSGDVPTMTIRLALAALAALSANVAFAAVAVPVPEIDAMSGTAALAAVAGVVALVRARARR